MTTHYLDEAERLCDRVAVLRDGEIASIGRPGELTGALPPTEIRFWRNGEEVVIPSEEPTKVLHELTSEALREGFELRARGATAEPRRGLSLADRRGRGVRLYRHELRGQRLLYTRSRELAFFTFLFPLILFLLLGSAYGDEEIEGIRGSDFLMAGTLGFGAVATAFGGLAIVLVLRREEGILKRLRATPLPSVDYIAAVLSTTMLAFLVQAVVTIAIAMLAFGASFPDRPVSLVAALVLGVAAFAALGVAITGFIRRAEGASAVVNAIYFPVLFISGSFFSQGSFPTILERVANVLPVSHFIQLVQAICVRDENIWEHPTDVAVIAAWGVAGAIVAARTFRWTPTEG